MDLYREIKRKLSQHYRISKRIIDSLTCLRNYTQVKYNHTFKNKIDKNFYILREIRVIYVGHVIYL